MMLARNKKGHISELVAYAGFFLGSEIKAEGSIKTDDDVMLDCNFRGEITTLGAVEIGKNCHFTGSIKARSVLIEGYIKGDVTAEENINLSSCGQFEGEATANHFSCETGSSIKARIITSVKG